MIFFKKLKKKIIMGLKWEEKEKESKKEEK